MAAAWLAYAVAAGGSGRMISCSFTRGSREKPESWEDPASRDSLSETDLDKWSICRITSSNSCIGRVVSSFVNAHVIGL